MHAENKIPGTKKVKDAQCNSTNLNDFTPQVKHAKNLLQIFNAQLIPPQATENLELLIAVNKFDNVFYMIHTITK